MHEHTSNLQNLRGFGGSRGGSGGPGSGSGGPCVFGTFGTQFKRAVQSWLMLIVWTFSGSSVSVFCSFWACFGLRFAWKN